MSKVYLHKEPSTYEALATALMEHKIVDTKTGLEDYWNVNVAKRVSNIIGAPVKWLGKSPDDHSISVNRFMLSANNNKDASKLLKGGL